MPHLYQQFIRLLILSLIILMPIASIGQIRPDPINEPGIDSLEKLINKKEQLQYAESRLRAIKKVSQQTGDDVMHARTLYDLLRIKDQRTEDSLYFRNSAFLDSMLTQKISPGLKAILRVMRARRIAYFDMRQLKFNAATYQTKDLMRNYAALNNMQRDSLANADLSQALTYNGNGIEGKRLLWLSATPDIFLFDPGFADIVLSERVGIAIARKFFYTTPPNFFQQWLSMSDAAFNARLDTLSARSQGTANILIAYRDWMAYHKKDKEVSAFLGSLARKFIFMSGNTDTAHRLSYIKYLQYNSVSAYPALRAHMVYQLCLAWNQDGLKYMNYADLHNYTVPTFDPQFQYYPAKALQLFTANRDLMRKYLPFYKVLEQMERQITAKGLRIQLNDRCLPGQAIPFRVMYKNTDTLYYRVVNVGYKHGLSGDKDLRIGQLLKRRPVIQDHFVLPVPPDNNGHAIYLKLDPLPVGHYQLIFSNKPIGGDVPKTHALPFVVTQIAAINADEKVFVLDRKTGQPLKGTHVMALRNGKQDVEQKVLTVNVQGYVRQPDEMADSVMIVKGNDTIGYHISQNTEKIPYDAFDKDDGDTLDEFFADAVKVQAFTDRSIYRPGQKVHYKLIFFTKDPRTGDHMLMTRANLGGGLFNDRVKKWLSDPENSKLVLKNNFDKQVDSATITINGFGSFAGEFTLPKNAATGTWTLDGPDIDYQNKGSFEVEEYKRPTLDLTIEKQKKTLIPGQPFKFVVKLRSFSGANIVNVPVKYTITSRDSRNWERDAGNQIHELDMDTVGYTDQQGRLVIAVNDNARPRFADTDIKGDVTYFINARAVDLTGESAEADEHTSVAQRPLKIRIPVRNGYDRRSVNVLQVSTSNVFEGNIGRMVNVKIYKVTDPDSVSTGRKQVDQWYYPRNDWGNWFPEMAEKDAVPEQRVLVLDTIINTAEYGKLQLPKNRLSVGFYRLDATCTEANIVRGEVNLKFSVFDSGTMQAPGGSFVHMPYNLAKPGERISWYTTTPDVNYAIYHVAYKSRTKEQVIQYVYQFANEAAGLHRFNYRISKDAVDEVEVRRLSISNNQLSDDRMHIRIEDDHTFPDIVIEKYRKVMRPGAKETFAVSIKTQNHNIAAELMTTLYDASLDKLEAHEWHMPDQRYQSGGVRVQWNTDIATLGVDGLPVLPSLIPAMTERDAYRSFGTYNFLNGKLYGLNIDSAPGMSEVVVSMGYARSVSAQSQGFATTLIRNNNVSLETYKQPLVILDGVVFTGDLKTIKMASITEGQIFKGAEAVQLFGAAAAKGVLVLSTKGPIILPTPAEPVVKVRKDFNETAFFYPQIHAGKDGLYTFSFTMPEIATEWNWKMMAHTRDARFVYLEKKLQTQLNLMVQPNMPRLLYQGDKMVLRSRISNMDTIAVNGKATVRIEDAVTGEDLTVELLTDSSVPFSAAAKGTTSVGFNLSIPQGQLNPLKIVITASAAGIADAEEHIIPILSPKVFVRHSVPVRFGDRTFLTIASKVPANADMYGVGISIDQKPQASLLYALPWLANYAYDCAEQTFNKLRANLTALKLMQTDTGAQKAFAKAAAFVSAQKTKEQVLPDVLAATATPWLSLVDRSADQQHQLFKLLDTTRSIYKTGEYLQRLYKLQQADGGLSWFDGGKSSPYISAYILAGLGQLKGASPARKNADNAERKFTEKLIGYTEDQLVTNGYKQGLYPLYAMSFWLDRPTVPLRVSASATGILNLLWQSVDKISLQQQAMLMITTFWFATKADPLYQRALNHLQSIKQLAIVDDVNGLRWKEIADSNDLNTSAEETMALLAEAFEAAGQHKDVHSGILKWLLTAKQGEHWQTTKATASAITMLQKEKGSAFGDPKAFGADVGGKPLAVSDGLLNGVPEAFTLARSVPANITLQQQGSAATGALTWYYFAGAESLDTLNRSVKISKQYRYRDAANGWTALKPGTELKAGDKIQVTLTVSTNKQLKFINISDPRAAAFEPADNASGYQYSDGVGHYRSVRDTGLEIFADEIPAGISTFVYELVVVNSGKFTSGPARLQGMYAPSVTAYSGATKFVVQ